MTEKNVDQKAERDAWFHDQSINISIPSELSNEELVNVLSESRGNLENLKREYWQKKKGQEGETRETIMYLHEITRIVNAIETVKNKLVLTGTKVPLDDKDIEHPDSAFRRFSAQAAASGGCLTIAVAMILSVVLLILIL